MPICDPAQRILGYVSQAISGTLYIFLFTLPGLTCFVFFFASSTDVCCFFFHLIITFIIRMSGTSGLDTKTFPHQAVYCRLPSTSAIKEACSSLLSIQRPVKELDPAYCVTLLISGADIQHLDGNPIIITATVENESFCTPD